MVQMQRETKSDRQYSLNVAGSVYSPHYAQQNDV